MSAYSEMDFLKKSMRLACDCAEGRMSQTLWRCASFLADQLEGPRDFANTGLHPSKVSCDLNHRV